MTRILLVEDDEKIRANLLFQLRAEGFAPQAMGSGEEAYAHLADPANSLPELLLLDVRLDRMSGVDLIRLLAPRDRLPPTIIISGEASISETVEALRLGVHDFIEKPFSKERLLQSIRNTLENAALKRRVAVLESRLDEGPEILGAAPVMTRLREALDKVAPTDGRVLIRGESGTGKELVAETLHRKSARRDGPFVKINCAAIAPNLLESELFGHEKGAFTGADRRRIGKFEQCHGGTLFLDEIGDMDVALQARLLRVLEDGRVRRIGETRDRLIDTRVIAATHRDLEGEVKDGRFRQDLYFRLAHLPVEVPPLRARGGDIALLFNHFLERFTVRHRARRKRVDDSVLPLLERYPWPGNVRELRNLCERLVIFAVDPITADQLPSAFFQEAPAPETGFLRLHEAQRVLPWRDFKAESEREYLESVLRRTGWNFAAAARLLDIQRTYLHQKVAALGIERPAAKGS
jgi:DNA-binding NtrC family response regulator